VHSPTFAPVKQIKKYSSNYKLVIAQDKLFPSKFEWVVDLRFHLFLQDCRKSLDQEDVNNQIIDFNDLRKDVILQKFNVAALPASFSVVELTTKIKRQARPKEVERHVE
jgi:hypothetical protein